MPEIVIDAFANDLKPIIDAQRRLMARWSCSTILFKYPKLCGHRKDKPPSLVMFTTLDWFGLGKIGEFPGLDRGRVAWRSAPDTS